MEKLSNGWYLLPNGKKVHGEAAALAASAALTTSDVAVSKYGNPYAEVDTDITDRSGVSRYGNPYAEVYRGED